MPLRRPPLYDAHAAAGARTTEFGGWEMPVQFDGITTEHAAVREAAGKFDVSHMGQVRVTGPDAAALMQRLTTNDVTRLDAGDAQYAMVCDGDGVIIDDTVVYRLADVDGDPAYLFVPNAGHDAQMTARWERHADRWDLDARVANETDASAMVAVQGPEAEPLLAAVAEGDVRSLGRFEHADVAVAGASCLVARTGYTGEDGFEVVCPAEQVESVWSALDCQPCGLGARDTLRIEMGYLLSGQDFDPDENPRNPYEAGVAFTVALDTEFVGRDALAAVAETGPDERFTGVRLSDRGVPRAGYPVTDPDGESLGTLTSGTMSPTLDEPVGLGYLPADVTPGTDVRVVIRGDPKRATVEDPPFLQP